MLKEIEIKNFRSFNATQTFTMEALPPSSLNEHPEHVVPVDGTGILKLGSIYGPNGSGKSNLIRALSLLSNFSHILGPLFYNSTFDLPFANSGSRETSLTYTFIGEDYEVVLSLSYIVDLSVLPNFETSSFDIQGFAPYLVTSESLRFRKKGCDDFAIVYSRDHQTIKAEELLKELGIKAFAVPSHELLASYIGAHYNLNSKYMKAVAFTHQQINSLVELGDGNYALLLFLAKPENGKYLAQKLNEILGTTLNDVRREKASSASMNNVKFDHIINGKKCTLSFPDESEGTQKLAMIIATIKYFKQGQIFYADDFDAHLHPVLVQALLSYFGSEENPRSQFIFNSHDILNMDSRFFRRDEIWFTTLDEDQSTRLYALADLTGPDGRVIRKDKKYSKQYLEGRYGADPFIAKGLKL